MFEYHSFENRNIFERTEFKRKYKTCLYSNERFFSFETNFERTTDKFRKNVIRSNDLSRFFGLIVPFLTKKMFREGGGGVKTKDLSGGGVKAMHPYPPPTHITGIMFSQNVILYELKYTHVIGQMYFITGHFIKLFLWRLTSLKSVGT